MAVMEPDAKSLKERALADIAGVSLVRQLEEVERLYLGRKGELTQLLRSLSSLPEGERATQGKEANDLRELLEQKMGEKRKELEEKEIQDREKGEWLDITAPGVPVRAGKLHPLTLVQRKMCEIFGSMGFAVAEGPEIEDEWHNFDALNIPTGHPAREMWDTFWLKQQGSGENSRAHYLLRTHTSPVQIRYMETHNPPFRIIAPGRIFRYEATDARHEINFYQLEGLMVGKDVSAANFKGVIEEFYRRFFGKPVSVRLRPSYFPFTEPSFEVDMSCLLCGGKGCSSCGGAGWIEIMGAGMVHQNVFKAAGYVPGEWQGFAFGMGVDRLTMMKYKINDIRMLYSGDLRLLKKM